MKNCHYINRKNTIIYLFSPDAELIRGRMKSVFRNAEMLLDLRIFDVNPHHLTHKFMAENEISNIDVIYVCSEEDQFQASYASRARELFGDAVPVIRPFYKSHYWNPEEKPANPFTYNILSKVSIIEDINNENLDKKAMALHNRWLKRAIADYLGKVEKCIVEGTEIREPKPTMLPWHMLSEETRDDNRSVVDFISTKLRTVSQLPKYNASEKEAGKEINFDFLADENMVEQLAEMEHRRWMATLLLNGWEPGNERDPLARVHESLRDYELLDEETREYDRQQIMDMKEIIYLTS